MQRMKQGVSMAETERWALAVSDLTKEVFIFTSTFVLFKQNGLLTLIEQVKNTIYKNMKRLNLDTNQLYIISASSLRDFVIMLLYGHQRPNPSSPARLIHEKILVTNLLDTIANRQNNKYNDKQPEDDDDDCSICCSSTSSPMYI
jgi:hypothetical protein